jgi:hypothetical protein
VPYWWRNGTIGFDVLFINRLIKLLFHGYFNRCKHGLRKTNNGESRLF